MEDQKTLLALIVDDDPRTLRILAREAERLGFSVRTAISGMKALDQLSGEEEFDVVITDTRMDNGDGVGVLQGIWRMRQRPPTLLHSGDLRYFFSGKVVSLESFVAEYFGEFARFGTKDNGYKAALDFLKEVRDQAE